MKLGSVNINVYFMVTPMTVWSPTKHENPPPPMARLAFGGSPQSSPLWGEGRGEG